ncbi:MAG: hypothetical protein IBJ10_07330 [Phycisphaerales bacterium]|nr:hypothetical protein [Phycisphaerales bacterium]
MSQIFASFDRSETELFEPQSADGVAVAVLEVDDEALAADLLFLADGAAAPFMVDEEEEEDEDWVDDDDEEWADDDEDEFLEDDEFEDEDEFGDDEEEEEDFEEDDEL